MNKQPPYLTYFFVLLFLGGFLTLLFSQEHWKLVADQDFPLYAKVSIVLLITGLIGISVEVVRDKLKNK